MLRYRRRPVGVLQKTGESLHNNNMSEKVSRLHWDNIAPASQVHAALFAQGAGRPVRVLPHDHADFCELFLVTAGVGTHIRADKRTALTTGDLCFLQAGETHALLAPEGSELCWINIAFPVRAWRDFGAFAALPPGFATGARLGTSDHAACAAVFEAVLGDFAMQGRGDRFLLARFLGDVCPYLLSGFAPRRATPAFPASAPAWLRAAAAPFFSDTNTAALTGGVAYLRERAGVTRAHLARALQAATGQTPTQWVNERRLARAALLLSVTSRVPTQIAADCGFNELGYFYRCFRARFGATPGDYRKAAHRTVPGAAKSA